MNKLKKKIIIFKNDRLGDFIWSIESIKFLILSNQDKQIIIFLSNFNESAEFFLKFKNVIVKKIKYRASLLEKIYIFFFLLTKDIQDVYILAPKSYFFFLPLLFFFKKINFYGYCLKNINQKNRPNSFFRFFLKKYIVNDRSQENIRPHTSDLQKELVGFNSSFKDMDKNLKPLNNFYYKKYILFHFKKNIFDELSWDLNILKKIFSKILSYNFPVFLIKDLEENAYDSIFAKEFSILNSDSFLNKESLLNKVYYVPNISGNKFFNIISNAKLVIAPHGTPTSLSFYYKVKTIDLFYFKSKNLKTDFYKIKNAFHEFKPKNKDYLFTTINKNYDKTINKINYLIKKLI